MRLKGVTGIVLAMALIFGCGCQAEAASNATVAVTVQVRPPARPVSSVSNTTIMGNLLAVLLVNPSAAVQVITKIGTVPLPIISIKVARRESYQNLEFAG